MSQPSNILIGFFEWWNTAMRSESALTAEAFANFFAPHGQLVVNGNFRAQGPDALAIHYQAIKASLDDVQMVLPVEHTFAADNNIFVHCQTRALDKGVERSEDAMAYAKLEDGKIALLKVIGRQT